MFREKSLITSVTSKAVKGLKKKKTINSHRHPPEEHLTQIPPAGTATVSKEKWKIFNSGQYFN